MLTRRHFVSTLAVTAVLPRAGLAQTAAAPEKAVSNWYRLILELVRHTPTYTPPVASRAFGYIGVTAYEAVASGRPDLKTLAGQLNALGPLTPRDAALTYDDGVVLNAALTTSVQALFFNTGPTGQRAMAKMAAIQRDAMMEGIPSDIVARSETYGIAIANQIIDWSKTDGGAETPNMGFPLEYTLTEGPERWVPTSLVRQQQTPLLPNWGKNRPFAMPTGNACPLPPPPAYSEDAGSVFHTQALEVMEVKKNLTPEQRAIARFWSDDPMLSPTPPGHWISIALQLLQHDGADVVQYVDVLARVGMAVTDGFIGCWAAKFEYDLLRPVTYIRRLFDPKWEPLLNTPPFPEYPSGHSTQSAAAAAVLTVIYGPKRAFDDATHVDDGLPVRSFPNFAAAAAEAGISRLYGGIHFRAAIERGLEQGLCIGAHVSALKTRHL